MAKRFWQTLWFKLAAGFLLLALAVGLGAGAYMKYRYFPQVSYDTVPPELPAFQGGPRVLVFSKTNGYRHLEAIPADVRQRAKLLVLNYPNSPTGKVATREFYEQVIEFAQTNQIVVVQDAAHILLTFSGQPFSFLSVPGAREVGVEVHSLSKGFNMIGWRLGWVCGHERIVQALADVKDNSDSGQFIAIQKAAVTALDDDSIPVQIREKYRRRMAKLVQALTRCGFVCRMPGGSYFLYTRSPRGLADGPAFDTAEAASQYLITRHSIVTVPWDDAGPFLRFSVTYEAADEAAEDALMAETVKRLTGIRLVF